MIRSLLMLAAITSGSSGAAAPALQAAADPAVVRQAPAPSIYRFAVGRARITALSDGTAAIDLHQLLRGTTAARTDEALAASCEIRSKPRSGELFGPGNGGRLPEALAAAGVRPEEISDILITHVHTDHSGGLVRGGIMLFPNATIHVGQADVDFFLNPGNAGRNGYDARYWAEAARTLKPYLDAGKVRAFDRRGDILPASWPSRGPATHRAARATL